MGLIFSCLEMSMNQEDRGRWQQVVTVAPREPLAKKIESLKWENSYQLN